MGWPVLWPADEAWPVCSVDHPDPRPSTSAQGVETAAASQGGPREDGSEALGSAQSELDTVAVLFGRDNYRPAHYMPGSLA